MIGYEKPY
ncbi:Protein of unknown function [Bacillus cytotoxicus]|nr:Protein of unknown function [Bacillus cytotoxicus]